MRYRNLLILAAATVVVIIGAVISSYYHAPATGKQKKLLYPDLQDHVNDVAEVVIRDAGNTLNLVRKDGDWTIRQADGYPALFSKIKPLILNVAGLKVVEKKTTTADLYPRLGVEDVDARGATSHLLELKDGSGRTLASLIVGKTQKSKAPGDNPGVYVRKSDSAQSLLVEGDLPVSSRPGDWFEKQLFNIDPERIASITIHHPDGPDVSLSRDHGTDEFTLADVPAGRKPGSDVLLHRMGTVLEDTYAQNVKALDHYSFPDNAASATIRTFDGLVAETKAAADTDRNYVHYSFSVDESKLKQDDGDGAGDGNKNTDADQAAGGKKPGVREEAENYNRQLSGWVYTIPDYKYDLLSESMDKLTAPAGKDQAKQ